jgi:hypothetical protein
MHGEWNSTVLSSGTYWGQFEEIGKYNADLNVAERLWAAWYAPEDKTVEFLYGMLDTMTGKGHDHHTL